MDTTSKNTEDTLPLTPEEIKAIGEIAIGPSRHEQFLNAHYKKLMWGGITLGIAAGGVFHKDAVCVVVKQSIILDVVIAFIICLTLFCKPLLFGCSIIINELFDFFW